MHVSDYVNAFWRQDEVIVNLCNSLVCFLAFLFSDPVCPQLKVYYLLQVQAQVEWKQSYGTQRNTQGLSDNAETVFKKYLSG